MPEAISEQGPIAQVDRASAASRAKRHASRPAPNNATSTTVIRNRFITVTPRAGPALVTASSRPYIDASRAPSPDGAKNASTATIAPTADTPPRYGTVETGGDALRLSSMNHTAK